MHSRILLDIKSQIFSGAWPPGHRIPFETKLAENYGVSRMTVNKVLTQLTRSGFLERRRKLGTIVSIPNVQSAVLQIADIEQEAGAVGARYGYRLASRSMRAPSKIDLAAFKASGGIGKVLAVTCLHLADDAPFCLEERLINLQAVPAARTADFATEAPGKWLLGHVPWSSARHVISARAADAGIARQLAVKAGSAVLVVERTTENDGAPVTYARLTYPGDKHQMVAQFTPPTA
jgi:GntR family histidine utilization transcriptional repressor